MIAMISMFLIQLIIVSLNFVYWIITGLNTNQRKKGEILLQKLVKRNQYIKINFNIDSFILSLK